MARPSGTSTIPASTTAWAGSPVTSLPSSRILPPRGRTRPAMAASVLLLPAPFGPMSVTMAPAGTQSDTPRTACTWP